MFVVFFYRYNRGTRFFFFFQAEDGIRAPLVTGVQTCALPIWRGRVLARSDPAGVEQRGERFRRVWHLRRIGLGDRQRHRGLPPAGVVVVVDEGRLGGGVGGGGLFDQLVVGVVAVAGDVVGEGGLVRRRVVGTWGDVADLVPVAVVGVLGGDVPPAVHVRRDHLDQPAVLVVAAGGDVPGRVFDLGDVAVVVIDGRLQVAVWVGDRCPLVGVVVAVDGGVGGSGRAGRRGGQPGVGRGEGDQVADVVVAVVGDAAVGHGAGVVHRVVGLAGELAGGVVGVGGGVVLGDAALHAFGRYQGGQPAGRVVDRLGALPGRVGLGVGAGGQGPAVHHVVAERGDRAVAAVLLPVVGVLHGGDVVVGVVAGAGPDQLTAVQRGGFRLALPAGPAEAVVVGIAAVAAGVRAGVGGGLVQRVLGPDQVAVRVEAELGDRPS